MALNGWEHHDLEKEIVNSNMAQLLELFKRESEKFSQECVKFVELKGKMTEEQVEKIEEKCKFLEEARMKIALVIAERLTDTSRIQHQVNPKR